MTAEPLEPPMDLDEAAEFSRYGARLLASQPELAAATRSRLEHPFEWDEGELAALQRIEDPAALAAELRRLRQRVMLSTLLRDLTGRADLTEVCTAMTRLAEAAIGVTVAAHHQRLAESFGQPIGSESGRAQRLIVVAMGKLGGAELNVSSDVDLVFVYPEDGATDGSRPLANQDFFDRLGRQVVRALGEVTSEGFVFRVDTRLRPYGDSGPLSCSLAALEGYLVTQGRTWERYAWLKARSLTGDRSAELEELVTPFVFGNIRLRCLCRLRACTARSAEQGRRKGYQQHRSAPAASAIELIVQAFQLVRGGREPALHRAARAGALGRGTPRRGERARPRTSLRRLEHRLSTATTQTPDADAPREREGSLAPAVLPPQRPSMPRWRHIAPQSNATSTPCSARRRARTMMLWLRSGSIPRPKMRNAPRSPPRATPLRSRCWKRWPVHASARVISSCRRCRASASTPSCRSSCAPPRAPPRLRERSRSRYSSGCLPCSKRSAGEAPISLCWRSMDPFCPGSPS
jgi:hypothetical protein